MLFSVPNFTKGETGLPSASPHSASAPAPDHLGVPLLNSVLCINPIYLVLGVPKLDAVLQMRFNESVANLYCCKIFFLPSQSCHRLSHLPLVLAVHSRSSCASPSMVGPSGTYIEMLSPKPTRNLVAFLSPALLPI